MDCGLPGTFVSTTKMVKVKNYNSILKYSGKNESLLQVEVKTTTLQR